MSIEQPKQLPPNQISAAIRELEQVCAEHQSRRAALAAALEGERVSKEAAQAQCQQLQESLTSALAEIETLKNRLAGPVPVKEDAAREGARPEVAAA